MSTQDEIREIVKNRYSNYQPRLFRKIGIVHSRMRELEKPLRWWQYVLLLLGKSVKREKLFDDEMFLEFLKKTEKENPRPIYKVPNEIKGLLA